MQLSDRCDECLTALTRTQTHTHFRAWLSARKSFGLVAALRFLHNLLVRTLHLSALMHSSLS